MKRSSFHVMGLVVFFCLVGGPDGALTGAAAERVQIKHPADIILINGQIAAVDEHNSFVDAVAIRDGKILAVGSNGHIRSLAKPDTEIIDLQGRTVLPGLIDGTLHGVRNGYHCFQHAVRHDLTFSRAQALAAYAVKGTELPSDTWIFTTSGWNVNQLDSPGMFTKAELDAALPNHPVFIQATGFSGAQVNTRALQLLGISSATGELTGAQGGLARSAIGQRLNKLTIDEQAACLQTFMREMNRVGLTSWDDPGGNDPFDPLGRTIEFATGLHGFQAVNELNRNGEMTARVVLNMTSFGGLATVQRDTRHALSFVGDDMLRLGGIGEEIMSVGPDGLYPEPEYTQIATHLAENRWRFEHHTGPATRAAAQVAAWERANEVSPIADLNWSMLHPADLTVDTLARLRALGAGVVPTDTGVMGGGPHPPYKRILGSGVRMCLGTDAVNAAPYPPFLNMWYTVSGKTLDPNVPGIPAEQRLTRVEALRAATVNCDFFILQEGRVGSLEPGKHADLIVLSEDYFTVPEDNIRTITSVLTIVGGEIVFDAGVLRSR
jgi:predicted amidohydrolase YtcJ